ncbi:membrane protein [Raoultella terrigena]|uniref:Membrane protein n=1 Tax=Raoultella terrigena TaxID=577 RepID=A0A7Z9CUZ9_RAOTE|nr:membrane protein [Raoultella terrigena]
MKWINEGKAPDYRFSLANERTFLAWIRTALAFMAMAIAVDQFAENLASSNVRELLVGVLSLTAALLSWYAYRRWSGNERAMREGTDLAYPGVLVWLSSGLAVTILLTQAILLLL